MFAVPTSMVGFIVVLPIHLVLRRWRWFNSLPTTRLLLVVLFVLCIMWMSISMVNDNEDYAFWDGLIVTYVFVSVVIYQLLDYHLYHGIPKLVRKLKSARKEELSSC